MTEQPGTGQWNWQWTATFMVIINFGVGAVLWTRGFRMIASATTVAMTLLGMYVIYKG